MIKSMTGFGRCETVLDGMAVTVELKAVNHRYFELSCRLPRNLGFLEERLKAALQAVLSRGKVDAFVGLDLGETGDMAVTINHPLAKAYVEALRELSDTYGVRDDLSAGLLARNNDILTARRLPPDEEMVWSAVSAALTPALERFVVMRQTEGTRLAADIEGRLNRIEQWASMVEEKSPQTVTAYREKLAQKMRELMDNAQIDEQRLMMEAALFADKIAADEETVRLRSHIAQFRALLAGDEPVGRKLDFLLQEMNREANTIGSKAQDVEVSRIVIDMKAELEKIREQIQNIE